MCSIKTKYETSDGRMFSDYAEAVNWDNGLKAAWMSSNPHYQEVLNTLDNVAICGSHSERAQANRFVDASYDLYCDKLARIALDAFNAEIAEPNIVREVL